MNWLSFADFFDMGGYGFYVWGSLGMCAAAWIAEGLALRWRRQALVQELQDQQALNPHWDEVVR